MQQSHALFAIAKLLVDILLNFEPERLKGDMGQKSTPNFALFDLRKVTGGRGRNVPVNFFQFNLLSATYKYGSNGTFTRHL